MTETQTSNSQIDTGGSHASKAQGDWLRAKLRIWCIGGWWFQVAGQPRRRLEGDDAASALLRHLALAVEVETPKSQLQLWLSRVPNKKISVDSLNTAISRLRAMLRQAAGGGEEAGELAKRLLPRAGIGPSTDGVSSEATYRLGRDIVWVDLYHAASPRLGPHLLAPRYEVDRPRGRGAKGELQGQDRLQRGIDAALASASEALSTADLEAHLKSLTPPISSLTALVPQALDRLRQGRMLSILAASDSGRMHLAEAIELGAQIYCGRSIEEIREQPQGGTLADDPDLRAEQPGHLCVIDLTRSVRQEQIERLEAVSRAGDEPPALLVVRDSALPPELAFLTERWMEEEPIELPTPGSRDVLEAFLIGTEGSGEVDRRRGEFEALWQEYESNFHAPMGFRAASSAASAAERGTPPRAHKLPRPPSQDIEFRDLPNRTRYLARCLGWFGNRPFGLEEARFASGYDNLEESDLFEIATKIPGGRKTFELRPQLIDSAHPPADAHRRICKYLIAHEDVEPIIERWPGRALRILGKDCVSVEDRLDLAVVLFETCRDQALAKKLAQAMKKLRGKAGRGLDQRLARFEIERARLLTHLGSFEEADAVLSEVTKVRSVEGEFVALKARARLRRAIAASRLGDVERARREAREARRHPPLRVKVESFRGWEATNTGNFEEAISRFEAALALGGDDEERADAVIGMSRDLIRLGRATEAEAALATLDGMELRRHSRDRAARVSASLCHLRGKPSEGIDRHIDPALLSASSNYSSASALLLEASAFLHLEAKEVNAAAQDMKRSLSLLANSGGRPNSATRYVRALIFEAEAAAARGQAATELLGRARGEADLSVDAEIQRNPWARARAHTLRGRLALRAEDWSSLAQFLGAALESHRELKLVCPGVLIQTVDLAAQAAALWEMESHSDRLAELARGLDPKLRRRPAELGDVLTAIAPVIERVEAGPPPPPASESGKELSAMGRVGEVIAEAAEQARLAQLQLQVLVPRSLEGLSEGIYEVTPDGAGLLVHPRVPSRGIHLIGSPDERRLVRRYASSLLLAFGSGGDDRQAYLALGEWLAAVKTAARERGVAVLEPVGLDRGALEHLVDSIPNAPMGIALAELPVLA